MKLITCTFIFLLSICAASTVQAQAGDWLWAVAVGGTESDRQIQVATDNQDNTIIFGSYEDNLNLPGQALPSTNGSTDLFIAKFDASQALLWHKVISSQSSKEEALALEVDPLSGHIYCGGIIGGDIRFGQDSVAGEGGFVASISPAGDLGWMRFAKGSPGFTDLGRSIASLALSPNGDIIVGGYVDCEQFEVGSITLTSPPFNSNRAFMARFDDAGQTLWAKTYTHNDGTEEKVVGDKVEHLAIGPKGNIYAAWYNGVSLQSNSAMPRGHFLYRIDENTGERIWSRYADDNRNDNNSLTFGLHVLSNGEVLHLVRTALTVGLDFGDGFATGGDLVSGAIFRIDSSGTTLSKHEMRDRYTGLGYERLDPIALFTGSSLIDDETLYLAGRLTGKFELTDGRVLSAAFPLNAFLPGKDAFVLKVDTTFDVLSSAYETGRNTQTVLDITTASNGDAVVAGEFLLEANFDGTSFSSAGSYDYFVARVQTTADSNATTVQGQRIDVETRLYPNPATAYAKLEIKLQQPEEVRVSLIGITGQLMESHDLFVSEKAELTFDLESKAKGLYKVLVQPKRSLQAASLSLMHN